jgi:hypothetical protein
MYAIIALAAFVASSYLSDYWTINYENMGQLFGLGALVVGYFGSKAIRLGAKAEK